MIYTKEEYKERLLNGLPEFTYWHQPCAICNTGHYTLTFKDTVEHARQYHKESTWAYDKTLA